MIYYLRISRIKMCVAMIDFVQLIAAMWIAFWIVFVINVNIWYWSLSKKERDDHS